MEQGSAEDRLKQSEERHRLLAEHANDVVWSMSPEGAITYVSPAVEAMRGLTPEEAMNQTFDQIHPPESLAVTTGYFDRLAIALREGSPPEEFRGELEYFCKDGTTVWTEAQVIPHLGDHGELIEILGVSRDISERKRHETELTEARKQTEAANEALRLANERLQEQAVTDELTGSFNRRHARQLLEGMIDGKGAAGMPASLLMVDVDFFKRINDTFGHQVGDQVLVELSRRITGQVRDTDVLTRWGGDEFIVLMPHCELDGALAAAEKIRSAVASEAFLDGVEMTVSIGVSRAGNHEGFEDWVRRADSALYRAKEAGRDRVEVELIGDDRSDRPVSDHRSV